MIGVRAAPVLTNVFFGITKPCRVSKLNNYVKLECRLLMQITKTSANEFYACFTGKIVNKASTSFPWYIFGNKL